MTQQQLSLPSCALHVSLGRLLGLGGCGRTAFAPVWLACCDAVTVFVGAAASPFPSRLSPNCIGHFLRGVCCARRAQLAVGWATAWQKTATQLRDVVRGPAALKLANNILKDARGALPASQQELLSSPANRHCQPVTAFESVGAALRSAPRPCRSRTAALCCSATPRPPPRAAPARPWA